MDTNSIMRPIKSNDVPMIMSTFLRVSWPASNTITNCNDLMPPNSRHNGIAVMLNTKNKAITSKKNGITNRPLTSFDEVSSSFDLPFSGTPRGKYSLDASVCAARLLIINTTAMTPTTKRQNAPIPAQNNPRTPSISPTTVQAIPTDGDDSTNDQNSMLPNVLVPSDDSLSVPGKPYVPSRPQENVILSRAVAIREKTVSILPRHTPSTPLSRRIPANTAANANPTISRSMPTWLKFMGISMPSICLTQIYRM